MTILHKDLALNRPAVLRRQVAPGTATGETRSLAKIACPYESGLALSPGGRRLAYVLNRGPGQAGISGPVAAVATPT